jgi:hypothetical protein
MEKDDNFEIEVLGVAYGLPFHVDAEAELDYIAKLEEEDAKKPPWAVHPEWRS